ncbi:MAG: OmpA family protein [Spirochaetia bacterium]|nr:OmpA family protein [Spirochaetia bacterium]
MAGKGKKAEECKTGMEAAPPWMLTYMDFITSTLCIFVILYALSKRGGGVGTGAGVGEIRILVSAFTGALGMFEGGQTLSKGQMEEMGMNLEALPSMTAGRTLSDARKRAMTIFRREVKARTIRITEDERGLVISLIDASYFTPGSALLTPELQETLRKSTGLIKELGRYTRVEGYAAKGEDQVIAGGRGTARAERSYMNTWDLAGARAINSLVFLQNQGIDASLLQAGTYGSARPMAEEGDKGTPESAAFNRRIDIVIMPHKNPERSQSESGFGLPKTRLPGFDTLIPDR